MYLFLPLLFPDTLPLTSPFPSQSIATCPKTRPWTLSWPNTVTGSPKSARPGTLRTLLRRRHSCWMTSWIVRRSSGTVFPVRRAHSSCFSPRGCIFTPRSWKPLQSMSVPDRSIYKVGGAVLLTSLTHFDVSHDKRSVDMVKSAEFPFVQKISMVTLIWLFFVLNHWGSHDQFCNNSLILLLQNASLATYFLIFPFRGGDTFSACCDSLIFLIFLFSL